MQPKARRILERQPLHFCTNPRPTSLLGSPCAPPPPPTRVAVEHEVGGVAVAQAQDVPHLRTPMQTRTRNNTRCSNIETGSREQVARHGMEQHAAGGAPGPAAKPGTALQPTMDMTAVERV